MSGGQGGRQGGPGGVRVGVKVSQGVKRVVRVVTEVTSGVYQGSRKRQGYIIKESLPVKYVFLILQETNGRIMILKIILKSDL